MKSALDKLFYSEDPLSQQEREAALRELVAAVADVARVQASPEHERVGKQIESRMIQFRPRAA